MDVNLMTQAMWWISVVEIPALFSLFGLILNLRREMNALQLDCARTYATAAQMRELEQRLTAHLLRIEAKLDTTALKTENVNARLTHGE
jgi:hypothetical protein